VEWSQIPGLKLIQTEKHDRDKNTPLDEVSFKRLLLVESKRGIIRGIHRARKNIDEIKLVSCLSGRVREVIVDLRRESPKFGDHAEIFLDSSEGTTLFLPRGVGQAYEACSEVCVLLYALNTSYKPDEELVINTHDPSLGILWSKAPVRNLRDQEAMSLSKALSLNLL
jgi:dTDP-4-dehydrorhamnose 3,5-epimerase